jgi:hypothetical protein
MVYVQKCMDVLKLGETRWRISGRFWDILNELSWTSDSDSKEPPPTQANPPASSLKHGRDDSEEESKGSPASPSRLYNYPPPPQVSFSPSALIPPGLASATPSPTFPQAIAHMSSGSTVHHSRLIRPPNGFSTQAPFTTQQQYYPPVEQQTSLSYGYPMAPQGQTVTPMAQAPIQQEEAPYMIPQDTFQIPDMFGGIAGIQNYDAWQQMALYGSPPSGAGYPDELYQGQPGDTGEQEWWTPYGPENRQPPHSQYRR